MKFRLLSLLAFVATAGLVACSDDPTDEGSGEPFAIVTSRTETTVARNTGFSLTAFTIDQNNRRIPGALTATPAAATLVIDSTRYVQELSETRFFLRGTAASAAGVDVTIGGGPGGLTASTRVIIQ